MAKLSQNQEKYSSLKINGSILKFSFYFNKFQMRQFLIKNTFMLQHFETIADSFSNRLIFTRLDLIEKYRIP